MIPPAQSICLCMIVKNEASVIRRCLDTVRPIIDHWLIVDTGSTDGTQAIICEHFHDIPGELIERPWQDFAYNRSEALEFASIRANYTLIIDADDYLKIDSRFTIAELSADCYLFDIIDNNIRYQRIQLIKNTLKWRYVGVLHEYLTCESNFKSEIFPITMVRNHDGARRRDPETYRKDAAILERALETESDPFLISRYVFYLAQSYRDCGALEQAVQRYLERAVLGYWDQEIFVSLYQAAKLMELLKRPQDEVLRTYARATDACSSRIEASFAAARLYRSNSDFIRAANIAKPLLGREAPVGGLFVETWIYDYGLDDEFSISAYWCGRFRESAEAAARALASPLLPETERPRILLNHEFATKKITETDHPSRLLQNNWAPSRPQGGTELMVEGLRARLGSALDAIDLQVNFYESSKRCDRPLVIWFHHDSNQDSVQWCNKLFLTEQVSCFVFVSNWQKERYINKFSLIPEKCYVIRNAIDCSNNKRIWKTKSIYHCAYTSTPFRGLDVLLDAWQLLQPGTAELHIWSSMKLYTGNDAPYEHLFERARSTPGISYHGIAPNDELRAALQDIDFFTYPSTFAETACLSVMEAMDAGCRVITPALGALPETTAGYARMYPWCPEPTHHAKLFSDVLMQEFANPWQGHRDDALTQQSHCAAIFSWDRRLSEWRQLIDSLKGSLVHGKLAIYDDKNKFESVKQGNLMERMLLRLRDMGFSPSSILDIGAHDGAFARAARLIFPDARILMIEALAEKDLVLENVARDLGNASHLIAFLGEEDTPEASFFVVDTVIRPDLVKTGSSAFRENSAFPITELLIPQQRLDGIISKHGIPISFIKLDVQGAELAVLRGLGDFINNVDVILTEISLVSYNEGAPLLADVVAQFANWGFVLFDIVEMHRYRDGRLLQLDGVFVRTDSRLRPKPPFWN